jgi:nicotinate-nucleotide--dimethylbenzimidazole phosphoribosyltransferase
MVANFLGGGAAINVIAREVGARVVVVDAGIATPVPGLADLPADQALFVAGNIRAGTGNLSIEPAMTLEEARQALELGATVATDLVAGGADCLVTGDMGIGNTTPSAALIAAFTGHEAADVTGRGTGVSDAVLEVKIDAVSRGLGRAAASHGVGAAHLVKLPPATLLAELGGLEIAALTGFIVGGSAAGVPVVVDGVIALAAALAAVAMAPDCRGYVAAGHRSTEPGASIALAHLSLEPLLDLGLRLGEGSGGCLALPVIRTAARVLGEMATFGDAGVESLED